MGQAAELAGLLGSRSLSGSSPYRSRTACGLAARGRTPGGPRGWRSARRPCGNGRRAASTASAVAEGPVDRVEQRAAAVDAVERQLAGQVEARAPCSPGRLGSPARNGSNGAAQEAGVLAGQERAVVAHPVGHVDEVGQVPARSAGASPAPSRTAGSCRATGRVISRPPASRVAAGQREVVAGVVVADRVVDRADERQVVGLLRQHRQVLAEEQARHRRGDRPELAADRPRGRRASCPRGRCAPGPLRGRRG